MSYEVREATKDDKPFLWQMLYVAAHMEEAGESLEEAKKNPDLARYVAGWGQADDFGFIAIDCASGEPIGAAWCRLFKGDNRAYGYLNDQTPEVAIGIAKAHRNKGLGTTLMQALIEYAKGNYPAISLSVRQNNPACHLYERLGFKKVPATEVTNHVGSQSITMNLEF